MIFTEKCYLIVINNIFIEYDELEKNITKIESEIPCLYGKLISRKFILEYFVLSKRFFIIGVC